jgi:hypothetical protein
MVAESTAEITNSNHLMRWHNVSQTENKTLTFSGIVIRISLVISLAIYKSCRGLVVVVAIHTD